MFRRARVSVMEVRPLPTRRASESWVCPCSRISPSYAVASSKGGEIVPQQVFHQGQLERVPRLGLALDARHFAQPGQHRGAVTPLARDDLEVLGAQAPDQDRLQDALVADRGGERLQRPDALARLVGIRMDLGRGDHPVADPRLVGNESRHVVAVTRLQGDLFRKTGSLGHGQAPPEPGVRSPRLPGSWGRTRRWTPCRRDSLRVERSG